MGLIESLRNSEFLGNSGLDYVIALLVLLGALIVLKVFREIILATLRAWAKKTKTDMDDTIIEIVSGIKFVTYLLLALWVALKYLSLPEVITKIVAGLFLVIVVYEIIRAAEKIFDYSFSKYLARSHRRQGFGWQAGQADERSALAMSGVLRLVVRIVLWSLGVILILSNFGVDITALVAGLGIGGIAVALAIQSILSDLFSSFSIYLDKPFQVGDYIVVGGSAKGTVERIGLKTTRIRSTSGEELVVSNNELTSARVQNFGRLQKRRASFTIGVVYGIKLDKVKAVPDMIREIVEAQKKADFDRCHFKTFGPSSLDFEIVFWVKSSEYQDYMDTLQAVNLAIYEKFAKEKIEFAYPTQTLFLEK